MKTSTSTDVLERRLGAIGAVRLVSEAGFEAIDYSMYTPEASALKPGGLTLAAELLRTARGYGACFNQAHAPFSRFQYGREHRDENRKIYLAIERAVEIAAELEAERIIIHPAFISREISAEERFSMNMEFFEKLLIRAKALGIKLAIENMWGREIGNPERIIKNVCSDATELIKYHDAIDSEYITVCLDVGHSGLVGEKADEMALALGPRLGALHIHDNDFKTDSHSLPYLGRLDFDALISALAKIHYSGDMTLEAHGFPDSMPDALLLPAMRFSALVCEHLRCEFEKAKTGI